MVFGHDQYLLLAQNLSRESPGTVSYLTQPLKYFASCGVDSAGKSLLESEPLV
jgi:hypothetical protein